MLNGSAPQSTRAKLTASSADVLLAATVQLTRQALTLATAAVIDISPAMTNFNGPVPLNNDAGFVHWGNKVYKRRY